MLRKVGINMAIEELLDELENMVTDASRLPLSHKRVIEEDEILRLVDDIRRSLPQVLQDAARVMKDREKILEDAKNEGEKLKEQARVYAVSLVDENAIVKQAEKRAEEILEEARRNASEMELSMAGYADNVFDHVENNLQKALQVVQQAHGDFRQKYSNK